MLRIPPQRRVWCTHVFFTESMAKHRIFVSFLVLFQSRYCNTAFLMVCYGLAEMNTRLLQFRNFSVLTSCFTLKTHFICQHFWHCVSNKEIFYLQRRFEWFCAAIHQTVNALLRSNCVNRFLQGRMGDTLLRRYF